MILSSFSALSIPISVAEPPFFAGAGAEIITLFRLRLRKVSYNKVFS